MTPGTCPTRGSRTSGMSGGRVRGFSLLELLVATAVLSTMMVLLFGFFDQATQAWQTSERKVDAFREARAALFFLRRDLQAMVVDEHLSWVFYNDPQAVPPAYGSIVAKAPPRAHGDTLFFISRQSPEAQKSGSRGDLCAVGYYLHFSPDLTVAEAGTGRIRSTYKLHRYFQSSDEAWERGGQGLLPFLRARATQPATPADALLRSSQLLFFPANPVAEDEILARNVINLFIRAYDSANTLLPADGPLLTRPAYFEISLLALNNDTAAKLASQEQWHAPADFNSRSQLLRENAREFRLRVNLP